MFGIVKHISDMNDDNYQGNDEIWLQFSVNIENIFSPGTFGKHYFHQQL